MMRGNQLFRKLIGPVVVRAVGEGGLQTVGLVVGPYQMIRGRLARRIGGVGGIGCLFGEGRVIGPQGSVDLVGGDMMEAVGQDGVPIQPGPLGHLQEDMGSDDVGLNKGVRPCDGAIDVGFGGKMNHGVDAVILEDLFYEGLVTDIPMDEGHIVVFFRLCQIVPVPGIRQGIQDHHRVKGMVIQPIVHKIGPNKTGSAGNQHCSFRLFCHD